jgi:hypothetical protein
MVLVFRPVVMVIIKILLQKLVMLVQAVKLALVVLVLVQVAVLDT